jgi:hypothetical protein
MVTRARLEHRIIVFTAGEVCERDVPGTRFPPSITHAQLLLLDYCRKRGACYEHLHRFGACATWVDVFACHAIAVRCVLRSGRGLYCRLTATSITRPRPILEQSLLRALYVSSSGSAVDIMCLPFSDYNSLSQFKVKPYHICSSLRTPMANTQIFPCSNQTSAFRSVVSNRRRV